MATTLFVVLIFEEMPRKMTSSPASRAAMIAFSMVPKVSADVFGVVRCASDHL